MALSILRDAASTGPEALVFSDAFPEIDALMEDLDHEFGAENWMEVSAAQADAALSKVGGDTPFAVVTLAEDAPEAVADAARLIRKAREAGLLVLLVVGDISSRSMHQLLKEGVADFAPYPEPEGALGEAINRLRLVRSSVGSPGYGPGGGTPVRKGKLVTVYGVAGGVGASTVSVNLAWELANA